MQSKKAQLQETKQLVKQLQSYIRRSISEKIFRSICSCLTGTTAYCRAVLVFFLVKCVIPGASGGLKLNSCSWCPKPTNGYSATPSPCCPQRQVSLVLLPKLQRLNVDLNTQFTYDFKLLCLKTFFFGNAGTLYMLALLDENTC